MQPYPNAKPTATVHMRTMAEANMLLADTAAGVTALEHADTPAAPTGAPQLLLKPAFGPAALSVTWVRRLWRQRLARTRAMPF